MDDKQIAKDKELTISMSKLLMAVATEVAQGKYDDERLRVALVARSLMLASAVCFEDTPGGKGDFLACGKQAFAAAQQLKEQANASC